MGKFIIAILIFPALLMSTDLDILFIGNSHTYFNDMPYLLDSLADAGGHDLRISVSGVGGATLLQHYQYQPTLDSLAARDWDLVVLQEHSLLTFIPYWRDVSFYSYAGRFNDMIQEQGGQSVLFAHHARSNPSGPYCIDGYCSESIRDYAHQQSLMSQSYAHLADSLGTLLVPVGDVWADVHEDQPLLPLWHGDNLHASAEGGYLTACIFYRYLLNESPEDLPFYGSLAPERARQYQTYAGLTLDVDHSPRLPHDHRIKTFPNPFNAELQIQLSGSPSGPIQIIDMQGKMVKRWEPDAESANIRLSWDGRDNADQDLPTGTYFIQTHLNGIPMSSKVLLLK